jgi:hypothetical protein
MRSAWNFFAYDVGLLTAGNPKDNPNPDVFSLELFCERDVDEWLAGIRMPCRRFIFGFILNSNY